MDSSRHTLIGLFGHCPEAKTHFTVSNPKHGFNFKLPQDFEPYHILKRDLGYLFGQYASSSVHLFFS